MLLKSYMGQNCMSILKPHSKEVSMPQKYMQAMLKVIGHFRGRTAAVASQYILGGKPREVAWPGAGAM